MSTKTATPSTDGTKQLTALLKKLPAPPAEKPEYADPIEVLIESFLLWESSTDKARAAYERVVRSAVDLNDLRVTMPHEMVDVIGVRYPRALDRCQRLRATLRDVFLREHAMTLASMKAGGKRDARKYLETLDGIVPYVVARTLLLGLGSHAIPVDEQLRDALVNEGVADAGVDLAELSNWLTRQIKASDGVTAHRALQAWIEGGPAKPAKRASTRAGSSKKTTTKKKTSSTKASSASKQERSSKAAGAS